MSVTTERLPGSLLQLEITVEPARIEASKERAVRRLSQKVRIPGFRPGKAPRRVLERTVGEGALLQEALDELLPEVYSEAIAAESISPIDQPELDIKSVDPLVVVARVPVRPTVDLKDYLSLRVPRPEVPDRPEMVDETIENIRRRFATLEPVDRPIQWTDTVRADVTVAVEGQGDPHVEEDAEFALREGQVISLPGFSEQLIGLTRGGPYEFSFTLPDDFAAADIAGKPANYSVTIKEVKQEVLPDLDDQLVQSLDEAGVETVEQLRERVTESVRARLEQDAETVYREEAIDLLVATSELDYPQVLVEREIDRQVDQASNHASHTPEGLQRWLQTIGRTEAEVRDEFREQADLSVRRAIVLGELQEREHLEVTDEDMATAMDEFVTQMLGQITFRGGETDAAQLEQFRAMFDTEATRDGLRRQKQLDKTIARLAEITSQGGAETAAGEPRRGSRRRRANAEGEAPAAEADAAADGGTDAAE